MMANYIPIQSQDINKLTDGTEVIVERKHWDKRGYPMESDFYRAIIGHHMTVSGLMADMTAEPNFEFPKIPPWQGKIYAQNSNCMQLWKKGE